ncbi:putative coiled-coil domain-containing protein domain-containing protein [Ditylenchus destructor]|uniref:Coiled-coil domain-containing protein domain-containing protein n=1 Tax=Ditylenchus destructor TaxID=166010 RepID=A0AAD4NGC6_9BILA|nr:putative coiled-coil domain-containing protein domain-containing protein [Ditylenchus destructor]
MSTVSGSTTDTNAKYQRLSAEFLKIRNQVSVLKTALLEEQGRTSETQAELATKDTKLRKLTSENESLVFRNEQLLKRVESLQSTLDSNNAAFASAKNKKKHKDANLRLFGESSRQQSLVGSAQPPVDPMLILEQELERKLVENGELHSKLFDIEKQHDAVVGKLVQRIDQLELENEKLQKAQDNSVIASTSSQNLSPTFSKESSTTSNPVETEMPNQNGPINAEDKSMENFYTEKICNLTQALKHAKGRAEYYRQECEALVRRNLADAELKSELEKKIKELEENCVSLNDALETTRSNYEDQMRGLYEHMAEQDAKIVEQAEILARINGINGDRMHQSVDQSQPNHGSRENGIIAQNFKKNVRK